MNEQHTEMPGLTFGEKTVIVSQSYGEVENCLYIAGRAFENGSAVTVVVPGNKDFFEFMRNINERKMQEGMDLVYFDLFSIKEKRRSRIGRFFQVITNVIRERRHNSRVFRQHLSHLEGADIYFFTRFTVPYNLYFLRKLGRKNRLIYMHIVRKRVFQELDNGRYGEGLSKFKPESLFEFGHWLRQKLVYGCDMTQVKLLRLKVDYLPDSFMRKDVTRVITETESRELLSGFNYNDYNIFDVAKFRVIFFDQRYYYRPEMVDPVVYKEEMDAVFDVLKKYFTDEEIAVKYHPGDVTEKTMIPVGTMVPTYIPGEFLYNDNVRMYLSLTSGSLGNVEKGLAVSLVDLITYRTEKLREQSRNAILRKSHAEILFPGSLEEFEEIVKKLGD